MQFVSGDVVGGLRGRIVCVRVQEMEDAHS